MAAKRDKKSRVCNFEEFEKFKSMHDRLERLTSLTEFERLDLADDIRAFSSTYLRISFRPNGNFGLVAGGTLNQVGLYDRTSHLKNDSQPSGMKYVFRPFPSFL